MDDQEICRVCRCESTPDHPLFHPCKCSGSIRFVHQDCLLEWLSHSRKKYCELCDHSFIFTPIYRSDMPQYIPTYVIFGQCISKCSRWMKTGLRALLVAIVWLVLLPYVNLWIWRFYSWSIESLNYSQGSSYQGYNRTLSTSLFNNNNNNNNHHHQKLQHNQLQQYHNSTAKSTIVTTHSFLHYNFREFLADCFEGQIITAIIIIIVVAAYLFREWVIQNTPVEVDQELEIEEINEENNGDTYDQQQQQQYETTNFGNTNNNRHSISSLVQQQVAVDVLLNALNDMEENQNHNDNDDRGIKSKLKNIHDELEHNLTVYDSEDEEFLQEQYHSNRSSMIINNSNNSSFDYRFYNPEVQDGNEDREKEKEENEDDDNDDNDDDDEEKEIERIMQSIMLQDSPTTSKNSIIFKEKNLTPQQLQNDYSCLKHNYFESAYEIDKKKIINSKVDSSPSLVNQELYSHTTTWTNQEENYMNNVNNISTNIQSRKQQHHPHYFHHHETSNNNTILHYEVPTLPSASTSTSTTTTLHDNNNKNDNLPIHQPISSSSSNEDDTGSFIPPPSPPPLRLPLINEHSSHNNNNNSNNNNNNNNNNINDFAPIPLPRLELFDNPLFDDDEVFDLGEDIDGVLEAIGMRGNPWLLLQNSVLVSVLISLCLGITVWIPYIVGRFIILFHPWNSLNMITFVLKYITDPIVDYFIDVCLPTLSPYIHKHLYKMISHCLPESVLIGGKSLLNSVTTSITFVHSFFLNDKVASHHLFTFKTHSILSTASSSSSFSSPSFINDTILSSFSFSSTMQKIAKEVIVLGNKSIQRWYQFALGNTLLDRGVCTLIGYMTLLFFCSWYLARHREDSSFHRATSDGMKEIIRQQAIFFKVFTFISLELVLLPIICGILLNVSTLPLIENATMDSRWQYMMAHPYSGCFLHWFVGTGFMFHFSVFVTLCRESVRPGVLWFIRDPNDPQFHPVQEIMERPLLLLLRKICTGALMYLALIIIGMGTVTYAVGQYTGISPLRLSFNEPLSILAIDILVAQFIIPLMVSYIKPREFSKQLLSLWWRVTSSQLRLSSYMFGDRYPEEEGSYIRYDWKSWFLLETCPLSVTSIDPSQVQGGTRVIFQKDGYLARVPKRDSVMVRPQRRMIVPIDPITLEPIDPIERRLGHPAANDVDGGEEYNTTIVYIPPQFKLRVALFLFSMWFTSSVIACSITAVPLLLGRFIFETYITPNKQVHDMYTFILGAFIMILLSMTINWIAKDLETFKKNNYAINYYQLKNYLQRKIIMGLKLIYLIITFGWIVPLLFGVVIDLYIYLPIRQNTLSNNNVVVIDLSQDWSYGIIYMAILYGIIYMLPINTWQRDVDQYMEEGLLSFNVWHFTKQRMGPFLFFMTMAILFPGGLAWIGIHFLKVQDQSMELLIFRCAYPIVFCFFLVLSLILLGMKLINIWIKTVRDDNYLVGKQLHNIDDNVTTSFIH